MKLYIKDKWIEEKDLISWAQADRTKSEDQWIVDIAEAIRTWYDKATHISIFTSGSTGTPKLIRHAKESMKTSALMTASRFGLKPGMTSFNCLPAKYIAGKMMLIRAIVIGMDQICVAPKLSLSLPNNLPGDVPQKLKPIDFAAMTPMQLSATLNEGPAFIEKIDQLILGGAPISQKLLKRIQDLKTRCFATYGMTETITHIATKPVNGLESQEAFEVLDGVVISTEDDNLVIKADHLGDEPIKTNDQVRLAGENKFVWIGRSDDVINRGGVKVHPAIIEEQLNDAISHRYIITAEGDDESGYKPALVIESGEEPYKDNPQFLSTINALDKLQRPENIYFVEQLIETPTGKVKRDINLYL